jgi:ADP-heptose:LPS heptosyltransferase
MTNRGISKLAFHALDRLTDRYPSVVPAVFQRVLLVMVGNRFIYFLYVLKYRAVLRRVKSFDKILLVADVNIGDAITIQQCVVAFRYFFPTAMIDYACNQTGGELVRGMPEADHVFRVFNSRNGFPQDADLQVLKSIAERVDYTVIVCFSPFVAKKNVPGSAQFVQMYVPLASYIIRCWKEDNKRRHLSDAVFTITKNLLEPIATLSLVGGSDRDLVRHSPQFQGNSIYLTPGAIRRANRFLAEHKLSSVRRLLFFNPDATSKYSQIPMSVQSRILRRALESENIDAVLLGSGHSYKGVEAVLSFAIPHSLRSKLVIVPRLPIGVYAVLIDACDMFLSSDTGPAHIAASWKVALSEYSPVRNRTAVVTVFGAGDSKMYGYDSERMDYIPANQLAPSKVFAGSAPCRNITCVNKWGKSCKEVRCFHGLNAQEISDYVGAYFESISKSEQVVFRNVV